MYKAPVEDYKLQTPLQIFELSDSHQNRIN